MGPSSVRSWSLVLACACSLTSVAAASGQERAPEESITDYLGSEVISDEPPDPVAEFLTRRSVYIAPVIGRDYATAETVREIVGRVSLEVLCPASGKSSDAENLGVVVNLERADNDLYRAPAVVNSIFGAALRRAYDECPLHAGAAFWPEVGFVEVYGQRGGDPGALLFTAKKYFLGHWQMFRDEVAETEAEARRLAEQQALAAAQERARAARQASREAYAAAERERSAKFWREVRTWLFWGAFTWAAIWLFLKRDDIARWYYALKPHPATDIVERAIHSGAQIDGDLYERILRPVPGSPNERHVRAGQARDLTEQLRRHEAALRAEAASRVEAERRRVEQENAFARAQAELLRAGVDHEIAAARVDELRRATRST